MFLIIYVLHRERGPMFYITAVFCYVSQCVCIGGGEGLLQLADVKEKLKLSVYTQIHLHMISWKLSVVGS